jgi:hypothetical protein
VSVLRLASLLLLTRTQLLLVAYPLAAGCFTYTVPEHHSLYGPRLCTTPAAPRQLQVVIATAAAAAEPGVSRGCKWMSCCCALRMLTENRHASTRLLDA